MNYGFQKDLYDIQKSFIEDAKSVIENNQIAIFSSPTGTGKTISLLCTATHFIQESSLDDLFFLKKTRIYYCSRTHSQLNQVLIELKSNKFNYKTVILGSRALLCINSKIDRKLPIDLINEKCLSIECEYNKEIKTAEDIYFNNNSLDIEEIRKEGLENKFCPYYYSKETSEHCEIVLLPYNLLFTKEGRESAKIDIKDKILIVDEAHNIYETIIQLNSVELSFKDIHRMKFIKGINNELKEIIQKIDTFIKDKCVDKCFDKSMTDKCVYKCMTDKLKNDKLKINTFKTVSFLRESKLENYNFFEIDEFIRKNKLAQKNDFKFMFDFSRFLKLLTFSDDSSIVIISSNSIKFTPLNPKLYFEELKNAKSIIFAGGTMEPINQIRNIFPEIKYFNYNSVSDRFLPIIISETVKKKAITLSFEKRDELIDDVVNTLINITNPIKNGGIIIFVPSFQFLKILKNRIFNFRRLVFFEDEISFEEFSKNPNILIAVMGGRLSEGINFSDDLCRLLILVGVPFPTKTLESELRQEYDSDYSVNCAMKIVNQTLGRAIRHKKDYSAMILLDSRYNGLKQKLSPWILAKIKSYSCVESMIKVKEFLKENENMN